MKFKDIEKLILKKEQTFSDFLELNRIYGFSLVNIENFQISETITFGLKQHIDENTLFQAASMSKSIFAATVMRLNELGMINIEKNLVPEISKIITLEDHEKIQNITYKDLLSHTAGFNIHGFSGYLHTQQMPSLLQILHGERPSNSLRLELIHLPRTIFSYSGGGYMLAQYLLEQETNKSYLEWAKELVFKPLKMINSFHASTLDQIDTTKIAQGWSEHDTPIDHGFIFYPELAAAGQWSTPTDLALFGIEMMQALKGESHWMTKQSAEMMISVPKDIKTFYGLGFMLKEQTNIYFGHGGDNIGYHSSMVFNPVHGQGIVVMLNSDIGDKVRDQIINIATSLFL
ncbi:MAG: beta-lactamase family protein [Firmicutes bacterium]|nr:beta-lactamase family protein [Bacillota bacterium]